MTVQKKLNIGILAHPFGLHPAAWLHPDAMPGAEVSIRHYSQVAKKAEQGLFDFLFLADSPGIRKGSIEAFKRWPIYMAQFEPITLLSAIAMATERLGLAATVSASFFEPFNLARQFASLDHLSGGRAAWNVVTSTNPNLAQNFSKERFEDHATRYRRAREFLKVVQGLWDSWDDDAFVRNSDAGIYFEPDKMHTLDHRGEFYSVRGPLDVPRPPQGHPVIIQAGGSEAGRALAAETAEVVFTADRSFDAAKAFRQDIKERMAGHCRMADQLKVLVSLTTVIGRSSAEAREKLEVLQSRIHPDVGREVISLDLGNVDLSSVPVDSPIPQSLLPADTERGKTYLKSVTDFIGQGSPTLKEIYSSYAVSRGGLLFVGTAAEAAEMMGDWLVGEAADGFMLNLASIPTELNSFVDQVVPELQKRGLFRRAYEGHTLRENLGLLRPKSRYV